MYYIGIDVGLSGSICILNEFGDLIESIKMPTVKVTDSAYKHWYDIKSIINIFTKYNNAKMILEYQHPMSGQGISTTFRLGRGFGLLEGLSSIVYGDNVKILDPKVWQNYLIKKYLTVEQKKSFMKKTLNYEYILTFIDNGEFKDWYSKWIFNKTTSPAKARAIFLFYIISKQEILNIKYSDHNLIDAYLIARYLFMNS